jgi:O-antigen/teichoic acid export membrane protein
MILISRLLRHELISGSFYLFLGGMAGNFLAFLLNLFLARSLSYAEYGIFASLLSIVTLAIIPASSISTIIVKFATNFFAKQELDKFSSFYNLSAKFLIIISITLFGIFFAISYPLALFLKLDSIWYGITVGAIISIFYLNSLNQAFLQSLLKFPFISAIHVVAGLIKFAAGVLFVYLGFKAFSGLLAIFFMTLGSFLIALIPLRQFINIKIIKKMNFPKKEILSYSIPAFLTVLFLTSFTSTDVILVRHLFDELSAGFYAGISLIGKVIFYFTMPIPLVLFPLLVKRHATGVAYKKLFYLALGLVFLPAITITIFYNLFPEFVINLFLGGRDYLQASQFLGLFGLFITLFSLVNVCVSFFLSFNQTKIWMLVIPAALFQIILIYLFHSNFYQVIFISIFVSFGLLVALLSYYFKKFGI